MIKTVSFWAFLITVLTSASAFADYTFTGDGQCLIFGYKTSPGVFYTSYVMVESKLIEYSYTADSKNSHANCVTAANEMLKHSGVAKVKYRFNEYDGWRWSKLFGSTLMSPAWVSLSDQSKITDDVVATKEYFDGKGQAQTSGSNHLHDAPPPVLPAT